MKDKVLINTKGEKRILHVEGNETFLFDGNDVEISHIVHGNEVVKQAFIKYLLLFLTDKEYKPH